MGASTAIDYESHVRDFTERARSVRSNERFRTICKDDQRAKGFIANREFVAIFRRQGSSCVRIVIARPARGL
jgi:serine/threonine-protein kinase RIO1